MECVVRYLHADAGFPTKATWLNSIHNMNYLTWTLITVKNVNRHFPESEENQKGHMRNQRQGVPSTKAPHPATKPTPEDKKRDVFTNFYDPKGTMYTDQTGKSTHWLSSGKKYQMIPHEIDENPTWIETMKNKTEGEMILAWSRALERMKDQGILRTHQVPENEISTSYIQDIKQTSIIFQLVPSYDHQHNLAEKAIQTWKYHFIGAMSGTAAAFPSHLW